jgi:hypothetical protein
MSGRHTKRGRQMDDHLTIRVLGADDEGYDGCPDDRVIIQSKGANGWVSHTMTRDQAIALIGSIVSRLNEYDDQSGVDCQDDDGDDFTARVVVAEVLKNAWTDAGRSDRRDVMADAGLLLMTVANWASDQAKRAAES